MYVITAVRTQFETDELPYIKNGFFTFINKLINYTKFTIGNKLKELKKSKKSEIINANIKKLQSLLVELDEILNEFVLKKNFDNITYWAKKYKKIIDLSSKPFTIGGYVISIPIFIIFIIILIIIFLYFIKSSFHRNMGFRPNSL